jgi:DNA-binding transcriptional MerR regulator
MYDFLLGTSHSAESAIMQIGEVAERTALSVDAIRFYEKRKLLPKVSRSRGRFRLYTEEEIERLRLIRRMQRLGFSLREIGELIESRGNHIKACQSVQRMLSVKLSDVHSKITELLKLEAQLKADLAKCNHELNRRRRRAPSVCPVLEELEGKRPLQREALTRAVVSHGGNKAN